MPYNYNLPYVKIFKSPKTGKKLIALCIRAKGRKMEKTLTFEGYWCAQYLDITLKELYQLPEGIYPCDTSGVSNGPPIGEYF